MKVEQFKEKYEALQKEGNDIYTQIKPLLKRLRSLSKKSLKLADNADKESGLYEYTNIKKVMDDGHEVVQSVTFTKGDWDESILFRLWDFEFLVNDPNNSAIDCIDNVLYNLKHTKFGKQNKK